MSYCNVTDTEDGDFFVQYKVLKRSIVSPTYKVLVTIAGAPIFGPDDGYELGIVPIDTSPELSFALSSSTQETGLSTATAGIQASFSIQAQDIYLNKQDLGTDEFNFTFVDAAGNAASSVGAALGASEVAPLVSVEYEDGGVYKCIYTAFVAGPAQMDITLNGVRIGSAIDISIFPSQMPLAIEVLAAETYPQKSLAAGPALEGFMAGTSVDSFGGVSFNLQARDRFGNVKKVVEEVYTSGEQTTNGEFFPRTTFRYNLQSCEYDKNLASRPELCDKVVVRSSEGVRYMEQPLSEKAPSLYNPATGIDIATSTVYLGEGQFQTSFGTTLAGLYDVAVMMYPVDPQGEISGGLKGVVGYDREEGSSSIQPYISPQSVFIEPAQFSTVLSELFFWDPPLDAAGGSRKGTDAFYSSLHEKTHFFQTELGQPAYPFTDLAGMAGVNSTFSIQRRDIYGNLLSDMGEPFEVELTTSLAGTGEVYSIPPEWLSVQYAGAGVW